MPILVEVPCDTGNEKYTLYVKEISGGRQLLSRPIEVRVFMLSIKHVLTSLQPFGTQVSIDAPEILRQFCPLGFLLQA